MANFYFRNPHLTCDVNGGVPFEITQVDVCPGLAKRLGRCQMAALAAEVERPLPIHVGLVHLCTPTDQLPDKTGPAVAGSSAT